MVRGAAGPHEGIRPPTLPAQLEPRMLTSLEARAIMEESVSALQRIEEGGTQPSIMRLIAPTKDAAGWQWTVDPALQSRAAIPRDLADR
jgi:hypothetical protein